MPNVLVLEDQPGWDALVTSAIRNHELPPTKVHRAQTYADAMRVIREQRIDLALLDYSLERAGPEGRKTGLDVARELRAVAPQATILLVTLVDPERVASTCEQLDVRLIEKGRADLEDELVREVAEGLASLGDAASA